MILGNTHRGELSPAKPAFTSADPLSITIGILHSIATRINIRIFHVFINDLTLTWCSSSLLYFFCKYRPLNVTFQRIALFWIEIDISEYPMIPIYLELI